MLNYTQLLSSHPAEVSCMVAVLKRCRQKQISHQFPACQAAFCTSSEFSKEQTHTMIISPDSCPDANRNPITEALKMTWCLLLCGSVSSQLPSCSFPFFNAPHCIRKRRPILTRISRALVSPGASPEDVKLLDEFGCHC